MKLLITLLLLFSGLQSVRAVDDLSDSGEQKTVHLSVDGRDRYFIVYTPAHTRKAAAMPMLLVLHGGLGKPERMMQQTGFRPLADRDQFILVYPAAMFNQWNDGRPTKANLAGVNDVAFIDQICSYMEKNYPVDKKRVYATGISNGGFMTSRLGCELSNKLAAIAVVSGTMEADSIAPNCHPEHPLPVLYIHGTADPLVSFNGGTMKRFTAGGHILSHHQVIKQWVRLNGCNANPIVSQLPDIADDGMTIQKTIYSGGINGTEVVSYEINGGGHTWPQGNSFAGEALVGKTSQDMNASETIWAFLKRFKR